MKYNFIIFLNTVFSNNDTIIKLKMICTFFIIKKILNFTLFKASVVNVKDSFFLLLYTKAFFRQRLAKHSKKSVLLFLETSIIIIYLFYKLLLISNNRKKLFINMYKNILENKLLFFKFIILNKNKSKFFSKIFNLFFDYKKKLFLKDLKLFTTKKLLNSNKVNFIV